MEKQLPAGRLNRRNLMIAGGGAVAAAGVFAVTPLSNPLISEARDVLAGQSWARGFLSLASATQAEWTSIVGSSFALGGGQSMTLVGVRALPSPGSRPYDVARRSGFLALFEPAPGQTMAGDLIYTANHPHYGALQLFLSSAPASGAPARMLAVFN